MHSVSQVLYHVLRGGGAVIEGAEFLLTHRRTLSQQLPQLGAAALCTLIGIWSGRWLGEDLPVPPTISVPWFLVLFEWMWSNLSVVLAATLAAWVAQTLYLVAAPPRGLVSAVLAQRGGRLASTPVANPRVSALVWLGAGGVGCAFVAWVPGVGPAAAVLLACPVLGGGLCVTVLILLGWPRQAVRCFVRAHWGTSVGLGLGLMVSLSIPAINLMALPCAVVGTACLLLREPGLRCSEPTRE